MAKLKDRIEEYQATTDYKLLNRVPVIIVLNGRGFAKTTQLLDKPYDPRFAECISSTTKRLCSEIEGAIFAYQHNDEIIIATRNDQNESTQAWFDNRLQKICSATASIATMHFNDCAGILKINLTGDPIFTSQVFMVPTLGEVPQVMVYKQQQNFYTSIQSACLYNLLNKYDKNVIKEMLIGLSIDEKINLLSQECHVDFNNAYPSSFRRGIGCYRSPTIVDGIMKNKWILNNELPIFAKDQSLLSNVCRMGHDLFRAED
jgi:tRNA(His) guanylyltransferase